SMSGAGDGASASPTGRAGEYAAGSTTELDRLGGEPAPSSGGWCELDTSPVRVRCAFILTTFFRHRSPPPRHVASPWRSSCGSHTGADPQEQLTRRQHARVAAARHQIVTHR